MAQRTLRSVLVTGAGGFMGSHFTERLLDLGVDVTASVRRTSDQLPRPHARNLSGRSGPRLTYLPVDLAGASSVEVLSAQRAAVWVHLAADAYVPASFVQPGSVVHNNVMSTVHVLDAARRRGPELLIVAGSSEVYGHHDEPITEASPFRPTTPYAASKVATEQLALSYHRTFGLPVVVARPFNCYGPRHLYDVIPLFIGRALRGRPLVVNGDGSQTRDFTYASDTVDALVELCRSAEAGQVFNIGSGVDTSVLEVARLVRRVSGSSSEIRHGPARPGEVRRMCSDSTALTKATGWRAVVPIEEGVRRTVEHARAAGR